MDYKYDSVKALFADKAPQLLEKWNNRGFWAEVKDNTLTDSQLIRFRGSNYTGTGSDVATACVLLLDARAKGEIFNPS